MTNYTSKERFVSAIGYIGILFLIPLFFHEGSAFTKFHGKQALSLFIAWIINSIIIIVPVLGWILSFFGTIILVIVTILAVLKAYAGDQWKIPFISKISDKLKI